MKTTQTTQTTETGTTIRYYDQATARPQHELLAFARTHPDLMQRWYELMQFRNHAYDQLMAEYRYIGSIRRLEDMHGETRYSDANRSLIDNGERYIDQLELRYDDLRELSWLIRQAYEQCDAAGMTGLLDRFAATYGRDTR